MLCRVPCGQNCSAQSSYLLAELNHVELAEADGVWSSSWLELEHMTLIEVDAIWSLPLRELDRVEFSKADTTLSSLQLELKHMVLAAAAAPCDPCCNLVGAMWCSLFFSFPPRKYLKRKIFFCLPSIFPSKKHDVSLRTLKC